MNFEERDVDAKGVRIAVTENGVDVYQKLGFAQHGVEFRIDF